VFISPPSLQVKEGSQKRELAAQVEKLKTGGKRKNSRPIKLPAGKGGGKTTRKRSGIVKLPQERPRKKNEAKAAVKTKWGPEASPERAPTWAKKGIPGLLMGGEKTFGKVKK